MAEVFVSPGVYTQEIDDTFSPPPGAAAIGAALVGYAKKGPAFLPTTVNSFGQFRERFGGLNPEFYMPYAAQSYLRNASTLSVTRVLGRGSVAAGTVGFLSFPIVSGYSLSAVSGGCTVAGIIRKRTSGDGDVLLSGTTDSFALSAGGTIVDGLSMKEASGNYIKKVLGTDPQGSHTGEKLTDFYVDAVFDYDVGNLNGTVSGAAGTSSGVAAGTPFASISANGDAFDDVTGGFSAANSPWIVSQNAGGAVNNLFRFFTRSHGQIENNSIKVQVSNVQTSSSAFPEFTLAIRRAEDDDRRPEVLESYENVNLDPNSESYIARVIGDRRVSYDLTQDPPELLFDGDFANKSKLVRIDMNTNGYPDDARPAGFRGVGSILAQCGGPAEGDGTARETDGLTATVAALPTVTNQNRDGVIDKQKVMGINFASPGVGDRLRKTVTSASGSTTADAGMLFISTTGELNSGVGDNTQDDEPRGPANFTLINMVSSNSGNFVGSTTRRCTGLEDNIALKFVSPVFSGWDGFDPRTNLLTSLNDGTVSGDFDVAKKTLANPEEVDFNLLGVPGVHSAGSGNPIGKYIDMVEQRADAFLLVDIANTTATGSGLALSVANALDQAKKFDTSYAATYYPWIRINDGDNNRLVWVPPSVEVMGAYAFNDRVGQPWFAPAGFNRGGLERVLEVRRRLTQTQRDGLYNQRPGINPIATFPGQGIVIFGQKTLQTKQSVLDRVNVRRMMLTVRKTISRMSRNFVFEQNNAATRSSLLNMVNGYLGSVQAANGVNEFRASIEEGADLVDRNVIKGKIFLKPTSVAEIIIFDFTLTPQGASFSE